MMTFCGGSSQADSYYAFVKMKLAFDAPAAWLVTPFLTVPE